MHRALDSAKTVQCCWIVRAEVIARPDLMSEVIIGSMIVCRLRVS